MFAAVQVYQCLSQQAGGNPQASLDEVVAKLARTQVCVSAKKFLISSLVVQVVVAQSRVSYSYYSCCVFFLSSFYCCANFDNRRDTIGRLSKVVAMGAAEYAVIEIQNV